MAEMKRLYTAFLESGLDIDSACKLLRNKMENKEKYNEIIEKNESCEFYFIGESCEYC